MFGDLVVNLVARVNGFTGPMNRARRALGSFRTGVSSAVSGVLGTVGRLAGVGSIVGGALGGLTVGAALTWGVGLALQAEKAQIAFEVMLGSADKAKSMITALTDYAASTPYSQQGIKDAAQTLLNFGIAGDQILPTISMLGDISAGNEQKLGQLSLVFGQIASTGRLMGQDLLQLINAGFNPLQTISERTGESIVALKKRMESGGVSFEEVRQAFEDVTSAGGRFHKMAERQSQTTSGLFSTLKDNVGTALAAIATSLMEGFDLKGLIGDGIALTNSFRANIDAWLPVLRDVGATAREWLGWLSGIVAKAIELWPIVAPWIGMLVEGVAVLVGMFATWSAIVAVVGLVMNPVTWIVAGVVALAAGVGWVLEQFGGLGAVLEVIGFGIVQFGALTKIIATEMLLYFVSSFNAIAFFFTDTLPAVFGWAFENGAAMFQNLAAYATQVFLDLSARLGDVLHDLWATLTGDELVGKSGEHWGELGARAELRDVPPLEWPEREASDFEQSLAEILATEREKLSDAWSQIGQKKSPADAMGLDPSDPKYQSGADVADAEQAKRDAQKKLDVKPAKLEGALGIRTNEAYKAIVSAALAGRGANPQEKQLQKLDKVATAAVETAKETKKQRELMEQDRDATIEDFSE